MRIGKLFLLGFVLFLIIVNISLSLSLSSFVDRKPVFTEKEEIINGLKLLDTKDRMLRKLGKPKNTKKEYWGAYGDEVEYCYYEWGYVLLSPPPAPHKDLKRPIEEIEITGKNVVGPRGIRIGEDYKRVIESFRCDVKEIYERAFYNVKLYEVKKSNEEKMLGFVVYNDKGEMDEIWYKVLNEKYSSEFGLRFELMKKKVVKIFAYYFPGD